MAGRVAALLAECLADCVSSLGRCRRCCLQAENIILPLRHPEHFATGLLHQPNGVLLYGPPGDPLARRLKP